MASQVETEIAEESRIVVECAIQRKPLPEDIRKRIEARSQAAQEELLRTHGVREIAVDLIREVRQ